MNFICGLFNLLGKFFVKDEGRIERFKGTQSQILSHKAQIPLAANDHQLTGLPTLDYNINR